MRNSISGNNREKATVEAYGIRSKNGSTLLRSMEPENLNKGLQPLVDTNRRKFFSSHLILSPGEQFCTGCVPSLTARKEVVCRKSFKIWRLNINDEHFTQNRGLLRTPEALFLQHVELFA